MLGAGEERRGDHVYSPPHCFCLSETGRESATRGLGPTKKESSHTGSSWGQWGWREGSRGWQGRKKYQSPGGHRRSLGLEPPEGRVLSKEWQDMTYF